MVDHAFLHTEEEWADVYRRNVNSVYKLSFTYLRNPADAEDAVQTVFLKWLQSKVCFNDKAHEKAWFITTTKNHCKDLLKSWWTNKMTAIDRIISI